MMMMMMVADDKKFLFSILLCHAVHNKKRNFVQVQPLAPYLNPPSPRYSQVSTACQMK